MLSRFDTGKYGLLLRILPHYVLARLLLNSDSGALEEVGGVRLTLFTRQLKKFDGTLDIDNDTIKCQRLLTKFVGR